MKIPAANPVCHRPAAGFSMIEMMVAMAAAFLIAGAVISLGIFTSRSFYMMGNYTDLDSQSRNAVDLLGREIRNSSQLMTYYSDASSSYLWLTNASAGTSDIVYYNPTADTLTLIKLYYSSPQPALVKTLLTDCDLFNFSLYSRAPNISSTNISFYAANSASACKVINFSWKCSRKILGTKLNTESVQTAQINLRNKTK
ncbi:MAG TPA: prepilin-type N-terminal cleavage/methylation domain-containing protein [Verrucomicrobiae bacterium]|nr:prepilin-type N-terminal cleavage/methylation domain-containing protein [Verrucomicrobiae bacterium]